MHSVHAAREIVLAGLQVLGAEEVFLAQARGRWLARPVVAPGPVPAFACSAMDGWAVNSAQVAPGERLREALRLFAGDSPGAQLDPSEAARIFTGAPLPLGADAVVPDEEAEGGGGAVTLRARPARGAHVRQPGEDVAAGAQALPAGLRLGARQASLCVALGVSRVAVTARARVALISTGNEIVSGQVADSNGAALQGALEELGCSVERGQVGDDAGQTADALAGALERADVVVTTAGVSVGEKDQVPRALERLGAQLLVHGVAVKPGKPFLFARLGSKAVLGLPGSPSACLAAFEVFARPYVLCLVGAARVFRRALRLPLSGPAAIRGRAGRARLLWAALDEAGGVQPLGHDVAQISGPARAQALLFIPQDTGELAPGSLVEAWLLEEAAP